MLIVMKAKQARVECIQKTFLHRKSFFPSFCGVGPLVTENQTLWLSQKVFLTQSKHATNQYKATSSSWLIHRTKLSFTSLNLTYPPRCLVCPRYNLCRCTWNFPMGIPHQPLCLASSTKVLTLLKVIQPWLSPTCRRIWIHHQGETHSFFSWFINPLTTATALITKTTEFTKLCQLSWPHLVRVARTNLSPCNFNRSLWENHDFKDWLSHLYFIYIYIYVYTISNLFFEHLYN
jgi:hypothetical protein